MKIKIGNIDFKILVEPKIFVENNVAVDGVIDYCNSQIKINGDVSVDYRNQVLCHEIIHGIINQFNVPINKEDNDMKTPLYL